MRTDSRQQHLEDQLTVISNLTLIGMCFPSVSGTPLPLPSQSLIAISALSTKLSSNDCPHTSVLTAPFSWETGKRLRLPGKKLWTAAAPTWHIGHIYV